MQFAYLEYGVKKPSVRGELRAVMSVWFVSKRLVPS